MEGTSRVLKLACTDCLNYKIVFVKRFYYFIKRSHFLPKVNPGDIPNKKQNKKDWQMEDWVAGKKKMGFDAVQVRNYSKS